MFLIVASFLLVSSVTARSVDLTLDEVPISGTANFNETNMKEYIDNKIQEDINKILGEECADDWTEGAGECYYFSSGSEEADWFNAKSNCEELGGILAEPRSQQEIDFLRRQATEKQGIFWIGGTDKYDEGNFVWASNSDPVTVTDWYTTTFVEPNNQNGDEDCIEMHEKLFYEWNDGYCYNDRRYICQK